MTTNDRDMALREFDRVHAAFAMAFDVQNTPTAALRYRASGDDYALGGLAVHVAQVLEKYGRVLDAMRAAESEPVAEPLGPASSEADAILVRDGLDADARATVLERVRVAHLSIITAIRELPEDRFRTATPVTFDGAAEPYPTSPADVLGWVHDHYVEHVRQVADLRSDWKSTQTA